jgi:hypothetical protein
VRSARGISEKATDEIGISHMWNDFQLPDMKDRLHEVALKITFWKKKANSLAFDSCKTAGSIAKLTTALAL